MLQCGGFRTLAISDTTYKARVSDDDGNADVLTTADP